MPLSKIGPWKTEKWRGHLIERGAPFHPLPFIYVWFFTVCSSDLVKHFHWIKSKKGKRECASFSWVFLLCQEKKEFGAGIIIIVGLFRHDYLANILAHLHFSVVTARVARPASSSDQEVPKLHFSRHPVGILSPFSTNTNSIPTSFYYNEQKLHSVWKSFRKVS